MDRSHLRGHRGGRAPLTVLVAALLAVVLAVAGCGGGDSGKDTSPQPTPVRLDAPPTNLTWTSFNGMSIPQADQGPRTPDQLAPRGFEQSPPGAALAAINATIRMSVATDTQWPQIVRTLLAPGPTRDAFIASRIQLSTTDPVPAGQAPRVLGWQVTEFTPQQTNVDVFTQLPDQSLTVNHTTVVWTGFADWGLLLPEAATTTPAVQTISAVPAGAVRIKGES
ncbi:Lipoprotein [Williamsia muralis]|uniref:hypothetical protein n=1 Tax=Williamsia marianensis TaxID=85044 RepID=UPI0039EB1756